MIPSPSSLGTSDDVVGGGRQAPGSMLGRKTPTPTSAHGPEWELKCQRLGRSDAYFAVLCRPVTLKDSHVVTRHPAVHWAELPVLVLPGASRGCSQRVAGPGCWKSQPLAFQVVSGPLPCMRSPQLGARHPTLPTTAAERRRWAAGQVGTFPRRAGPRTGVTHHLQTVLLSPGPLVPTAALTDGHRLHVLKQTQGL